MPGTSFTMTTPPPELIVYNDSEKREATSDPGGAALMPLPIAAWGELPSLVSEGHSTGRVGEGSCGGTRDDLRAHLYLPEVPPPSHPDDVRGGDAVLSRGEEITVFPSLGSAGSLMAKAASGHRLKRQSSYRQPATAELLQAMGGGDCGEARASAGGGSHDGDEGFSLSSTALTDGLHGRQKRKRTFATLVPLWAQVCLLMLVPVGFVTSYLGISFSTALANVRFINDNAAVVDGIFRCENALMRERDYTSIFLVQSNTEQRAASFATVVHYRAQVDATCGNLQMLSLSSSYSVVREELLAVVRRVLSEVNLLRFGVDSERIGARQVRDSYRVSIHGITNGIILVGRRSVQITRFIALNNLRLAANRFSMCRAIGFELLEVGAVRDDDALIEIDSECAKPVRRLTRDFLEVAGPLAQQQHARWASNNATKAVLGNVALFLNATFGDPLVVPSAVFYDNATAALQLLYDVSRVLLDDIVAAQEHRNAVIAEASKLFITLGVSLIGVLFVSRAQRLASGRVEFALERTHKMSLAVQAFIPRSFLRLMAVESILNLERGDQTQVAVTMLFCDIRNFTGISEHMSNEQLFEWLQAHLKRMTHATEKHRGFVSTYVGDAVSSTFLTPLDACRCAVKMQAVTDALCYELVAHNEDHMVRIGVGVHHALVGVGILGNDKHHSCAIVSSEVNVAAQLEALTKEYGARIIVTAQVHDQLPRDAFESRPLGRARLTPKTTHEYVLHEIFQADMPEAKAYKNATQTHWEEVLSLRETERFAEAESLLALLQETAAREYGLKDPAVELKRRSAPVAFDQFDLS